MHRLRHSKLWLRLLLFVAVAVHFGLGFDAVASVLCINKGGNVAVENATLDGRCDLSTLVNKTTPIAKTAQTSSSDCIDVPITAEHNDHKPLVSAKTSPFDSSAIFLIAFLSTWIVTIDSSLNVSSRLPTPPSTNSDLVTRRSVVLLI